VHREPNETEIEESGESEDANDQGLMRNIYNFLFAGKAPFWTALATVMMMVFSGLLLNVTKIANQINVESQRASLSATGPSIIKRNSPDGKKLDGLNFSYFWVNSGSTPAKDGKTEFNVYVGSAFPLASTDFSKLPQSQVMQFVTGPKAGMQTLSVPISLGDLDDIANGKKHMFFWGFAVYRDSFPDTPMRVSEFCTDVTSITFSKADHTDPTGDVNFGTPPCEAHNCYDEACPDYDARIR